MPTKSNSQSQPIQHNPSRDSEFQQLCTLSGFKRQVSRCLHRKCNHSLVLTSPMPNYIPPFLTSLTPSLSCSPHNRPSPPFPLLHSLPFNPIHSESSCPMLPCAHCHNLLRHPPQLSHATQQWWFQGQAHPCMVQDVLEWCDTAGGYGHMGLPDGWRYNGKYWASVCLYTLSYIFRHLLNFGHYVDQLQMCPLSHRLNSAWQQIGIVWVHTVPWALCGGKMQEI